MNYWLFKEEPSHYSYQDLVRDKRTVWQGVANNLALIHLRAVKKGDHVFYYHTSDERAVVGVMEVVKSAYRDPQQDDARLVVVDVKPKGRLARPVTLSEIKSNSKFMDFALVKISRLSVMPVTPAEWDEILHLALSECPINLGRSTSESVVGRPRRSGVPGQTLRRRHRPPRDA